MADIAAIVRSKLLAAASSATSAATDMIELARQETPRAQDSEEIVTALSDALRLAIEAELSTLAVSEVVLAEVEAIDLLRHRLTGDDE